MHANNQPAARGIPQATLLLIWLAAITAYRVWVVPRLGISLYIDEAQYWTWAQDLDWGYFSKPPVIAWLIALSTAVFGDSALAVKLPSLVLYPATAWLVFRVAKHLFDARIAFRAAVAFSALPIVSALGLFASTDAPLLFFWAAAMLCFIRALENDRWRDWLLLGACVGLGVMSKYTMAAFGASALLYLIVDRARWSVLANAKLWIAVALATVIVFPNLLWNWSLDFPTLRHTADITHADGIDKAQGNIAAFIAAQLGSLGPIIAIALLAGLVLAIRNWHEQRMQALLCFSLPLWLIVGAQALRAGANGNWAAPAMIAATILSAVWLSRHRTRWWLLAMIANLAIMATAYHWADLHRLSGRTLSAKQDILKRARGWSEFAGQVAPYFDAHPHAILLAENRTLLAHLLYELRERDLAYAAWAPYEHPQDHYQLTAPLDASAQLGRSVLFVTQNDSADVLSRFTSKRELGRIRVEVAPDLTREARVYLLEGFLGYR